MATEDPHQPSIAVRSTQPLVGVFVEDDSDLVRYFVDDRAAPQPHNPSHRPMPGPR
jgi:hypothetical protein